MKPRKPRRKALSKAKMLADLKVGLGGTHSVGSDSYPYYIASISKDGIVGIYSPNCYFEHDWTEGTMKVEPFNPEIPATEYYKPYRGKWMQCDKDGIEYSPRCYFSIRFGYACAYRDPSF